MDVQAIETQGGFRGLRGNEQVGRDDKSSKSEEKNKRVDVVAALVTEAMKKEHYFNCNL